MARLVASYTASSSFPGKGPERLLDDDTETEWFAGKGEQDAWILLDLEGAFDSSLYKRSVLICGGVFYFASILGPWEACELFIPFLSHTCWVSRKKNNFVARKTVGWFNSCMSQAWHFAKASRGGSNVWPLKGRPSSILSSESYVGNTNQFTT